MVGYCLLTALQVQVHDVCLNLKQAERMDGFIFLGVFDRVSIPVPVTGVNNQPPVSRFYLLPTDLQAEQVAGMGERPGDALDIGFNI
jgi:hypothetical protein